jgi:Amt family ammonium transporter
VAFIIGNIGGMFYVLGVKLFIYLEIDDPLEAGVVHGCCGMWGVVAAGLFNNTNGLLMAKMAEEGSNV